MARIASGAFEARLHEAGAGGPDGRGAAHIPGSTCRTSRRRCRVGERMRPAGMRSLVTHFTPGRYAGRAAKQQAAAHAK